MDIQKGNAINFHSALLNLSLDPSSVSGEKQSERLLWIYIKLYVVACIGLALYGFGQMLRGA